MTRQLNAGDIFPTYQISIADGRSLVIPDDLQGEYGVIIFYRGVW
jgi:peroxiredoxin